jgi:hypothetical protein
MSHKTRILAVENEWRSESLRRLPDFLRHGEMSGFVVPTLSQETRSTGHPAVEILEFFIVV